MHIYFSGIGGTGIGPLALIARQAGYTVSGSDKQDSSYISYLREQGIDEIHIGQSYEPIAEVHARQPIDWLVYSSAVAIEQPDAPEFRFCREQHIKMSKRDEFLSQFLTEKNLKLIAVAGTHGKTTTTAMAIWLLQQLGMPVSYSVGAKIPFGDMGHYDPSSEYFVYEADEFDRNFLTFHPEVSLITGIGWDHPDIYPTQDDYDAAFQTFIGQSRHATVWAEDAQKLSLDADASVRILGTEDSKELQNLHLPGLVNRKDALLVALALQNSVVSQPLEDLLRILDEFPGVKRRFEQLAPRLYTDYAHTPPKIRGVLQLAHEVAGDNVVVVYEGLHNTRQHFIKDELETLFDTAKQLYIVPTYLAREDPNLELLHPENLKQLMSPPTQAHTTPAQLDESLKQALQKHMDDGDLVLCLTAGGGGSLDEWLRREFAS